MKPGDRATLEDAVRRMRAIVEPHESRLHPFWPVIRGAEAHLHGQGGRFVRPTEWWITKCRRELAMKFIGGTSHGRAIPNDLRRAIDAGELHFEIDEWVASIEAPNVADEVRARDRRIEFYSVATWRWPDGCTTKCLVLDGLDLITWESLAMPLFNRRR